MTAEERWTRLLSGGKGAKLGGDGDDACPAFGGFGEGKKRRGGRGPLWAHGKKEA